MRAHVQMRAELRSMCFLLQRCSSMLLLEGPFTYVLQGRLPLAQNQVQLRESVRLHQLDV